MAAIKLPRSESPLVLYQQPEAPFCFLGNPIPLDLSNLFINSIEGNTDLLHARVTCLDDFHYCPFQKYIRAAIINALIAAKRTATHQKHKVIFMIEGTRLGATPSIADYEDLIGEDLIDFPHFCTGWDDDELRAEAFPFVRDFAELGFQAETMKKSLEALKAKRKALLFDTSGKSEDWEYSLDAIEDKIRPLEKELVCLSEKLDKLHDIIDTGSDKRDISLQEAIKRIAAKFPDAEIYVISGKQHLKGLSKAIASISHAIIKLKNIIIIKDPFAALKHYYCWEPISLLTDLTKPQLLLEAPYRNV